MSKFEFDEIEQKLKDLKNWKYEENYISKEFSLKDFKSAIAFVVKIGIEAELSDHHPDILIYGWNKVKVSLFTHSANGITEKDFTLAEKIEILY